MKVAALDLGSNTTLLLIAEVQHGKILKVFRDELRVTRLGQGVNQTKKFHGEALIRMDKCLGEYHQIIESEKVDRICAMATSAARDVSNGDELFLLGKKHQIPIEVIPGHQEAGITFRGATFDFKETDGLAVIDVGGGSTEIIGKTAGIITGVSVDVGSVRLTEMFLPDHPVSAEALEKLLAYVRLKYSEARNQFPVRPREILAVAGTPTTLSAVHQGVVYSTDAVHGSKLSLKEMQHWLKILSGLTIAERQNLKGMDPKRADVIVAGLAILIGATEELGATEITVSDRGVRYGVALLAEERK